MLYVAVYFEVAILDFGAILDYSSWKFKKLLMCVQ
jgi:hypothetical protein